ncbi:MAG TPA: sigma-70 family RNA polymerase sigma factor [Opitutaceae bacterium]|nr:sigma-70 family RNA polymerase sigma factor [Opitutaceae bacterium]
MDAIGQNPDLRAVAKRGGEAARIIGEAGERLRRFIRARVPNRADAEDILQDVWQRLVATLEDEPIEKAGAWLYTVARHRIIDRYHRPRDVSLDARDDAAEPLLDRLAADERMPSTELRRSLFWDRLHAALAELPAEQRQVFVWHELEGLSFQEMADLTGEKLNTLLSRKRYAVQHLRRRLESLRAEFSP